MRVRLFNSRRLGSISSLTAIAIVTSVAIAIAIAVALWTCGIIGSLGYGTRPVKINIYGDLKVRGNEFYVLIKNMGGETIYVDGIVIDNKWRAKVIKANDIEGNNVLEYNDGKYLIKIQPRSSVKIWGVVNTELKPGIEHKVRIHTTLGLEFMRPVISSLAPMRLTFKAIDTGLKSPSDPNKKIVLIRLAIENVWSDTLIVKNLTVHEYRNPTKVVAVIDRWVNGTLLKDRPIVVKPGDTWVPKNLMEYFRADIPSGKYTVRANFDFSKGGSDYIATIVNVKPEVIKAYLIYITIDDEGFSPPLNEKYPAWHRDPDSFVNALRKYVDIKIISKLTELQNFIEKPPKGPLIVINAHSEPLPIPKSYIDKHGGLSGVSAAVKEWYEKIRNDISNHKWVWGQPTGYPFWGTANKWYAQMYGCNGWTDDWGKTINTWSGLDDCTGGARAAGIKYDGAKWALGYPYGCTCTWNCRPQSTEHVKYLNTIFPEASLPEGKLPYDAWDTFDTSEIWKSNPEKLIVFYGLTGPKNCHCANPKTGTDVYKPIIYSLKVGNGWYVFGSLDRPPDSPNDFSAKLIAYLTIYTYLVSYVASK